MISITKLPGKKAGTLPVKVSKFSEVCWGGGAAKLNCAGEGGEDVDVMDKPASLCLSFQPARTDICEKAVCK